MSIGSGFIITSNEKISTQCDLIIYDKNVTPLIENEEQRFFPIECVVGIIEAKSKLTKQSLKETLIKLSKIKSLRADVATNIFVFRDDSQTRDFNTKMYVRDNLVTLLVCEGIEDINLKKDFNTIFKYIYRDIDRSLYHNMILSLDNGCFMYNIDSWPICYPYINYKTTKIVNEVIMPHVAGYDKEHILAFINYFFMAISSVSVMYLEITKYLGEQRIKATIIENDDN